MSIDPETPPAEATDGHASEYCELPPRNTNGHAKGFGKNAVDPTAEFKGDIDTDNTLPTQKMIRKIEDYPVLDKDGKSRPFKSLYTGPNVARRVLVIFIRHFFCGNCQEFVRSLRDSISTDDLLRIPVPTFIVIIGCGSPNMIPTYQEATGCPYPMYVDPTRRLYQELGMTRTWAMGSKPEYMRKSMMNATMGSIVQGLKQLAHGKLPTGIGDLQQVGGEFLFEPLGEVVPGPVTPAATPELDEEKKFFGEEKRVTWCHRMRNTRDHAEVPELREVLGLEPLEEPGKPHIERKGTGMSVMTVPEPHPAAAVASS